MVLIRTPEEWCQLLGWQILDPDGWRGRRGRPWTDPISQAEFERRAGESTARHAPLGVPAGQVQGRLDRILAEQKALPEQPPGPLPNWEGRTPRRCGEHRTAGSHRAWCHDCGEWCYPREDAMCLGCADAPEAEIERLWAIAVALEAECAALADALDAATHEPVACECGEPGRCGRIVEWQGRAQGLCHHPADHPVHRTAARVRAEHGLGAK